MQIKTKIVTTDSKPVKQEVNGTVILPPLVFPGYRVSGPIRNTSFSSQHNKLERYITLRLNILPGANTLAYCPVHKLRRKLSVLLGWHWILDLTANVQIVQKMLAMKNAPAYFWHSVKGD